MVLVRKLKAPANQSTPTASQARENELMAPFAAKCLRTRADARRGSCPASFQARDAGAATTLRPGTPGWDGGDTKRDGVERNGARGQNEALEDSLEGAMLSDVFQHDFHAFLAP